MAAQSSLVGTHDGAVPGPPRARQCAHAVAPFHDHPRARVTGPIHLHPTASLAERVLLPGDPGRALLLAQSLLAEPVMFNHHRGLWGYTGNASDGAALTIQSTGMGGPSSAIVVTELAQLGASRLIRVGTCGALRPALGLGELVIASEALPADGTSRSLGAIAPLAPDRDLLAALLSVAGGAASGPIVSTDLFYDSPEGQERQWADAGAVAVEMETAALFAVANRHNLRAASLLVVSDLIIPGRQRIAARDLRAAEHRLGELALAALSIDSAGAADPA